MSRKIVVILSLLLCLFLSYAAADDDKKVSPVETITIEEIKDHMYFLASDELGGRVIGTPGYEIAAKYAATQFRAAGIKPILKTADGKDTYLQEVPIIQSKVVGSASFKLTLGENTVIVGNTDNLKLLEIMNFDPDAAPRDIVFVGYGIEEPEAGWNDLEGLDLKGKMVIMLSGAPEKDGKPVLPQKLHNSHKSFPGLTRRLQSLIVDRKAEGLIIITDKVLEGMWQALPDSMGKEYVRLKEKSSLESGLGEIFALIAKKEFFKEMFDGQVYNPAAETENPMEGYQTFQLEGIKANMLVETENTEMLSWNVIGVIEGTDPELKTKFVSLAGHLDHIAPQNGKISNGADDNASGSIGVIEIGEALAMNPTKRSILLGLWTGEESGLLGSMHFVNKCPVGLENITVNINLDMIGRTDKPSEATGRHYALGALEKHPDFQKAVEAVNQKTYKLPLAYAMDEVSLGGSDHMNFSLAGIPSICFYSGPHKDYHKITDDAEKIEWDKMLNICKLTYELAVEFGNTEVTFASDKK